MANEAIMEENLKADFISNDIKNVLFPEFASGVSSNIRTREEYFGYIRILCNKILFKDFLEITEEDAERAFRLFRSRCKEGKLSIRTVKVRLACYNTFSRFIEEQHPEYSFINPFVNIEKPFLTDAIAPSQIPDIKELDKILSVAKSEPMYYLIIAMTLRTGISASKILRLNMDSVHEEDGKVLLYVPDKSEKKEVTIELPEDIGSLLLSYMEGIEEQDIEGHIFYNKHGNALTLKNIDSNVKRIVKEAGIDADYTLKDLRSRAILDMLKAGATEKDVCEYVGIGGLRVRQFQNAKGILRGCPADLVNFRVLN